MFPYCLELELKGDFPNSKTLHKLSRGIMMMYCMGVEDESTQLLSTRTCFRSVEPGVTMCAMRVNKLHPRGSISSL